MNFDDLKQRCFRAAKTINKNLQRSNMNAKLKPFFNESSVQFFDRDGKIGIALNVKCIDCESMISDISELRFHNNMKLIQETVNNILQKENIANFVKLEDFSPSKKKFLLNDIAEDKYLNCMLTFHNLSEASLANSDEEYRMMKSGNTFETKPHNIDVNRLAINTYDNIERFAEGPLRTQELRNELIISPDDVRYFKKNVNANAVNNIYISVSDMCPTCDNTSLTTSDERIVRRDAGKVSKNLVDQTPNALSEGSHYFSFFQGVESISEAELLRLIDFQSLCLETFFDSMYKAGIQAENDIDKNIIMQQMQNDIENIRKGKKVSFDYFLFFTERSLNKNAISQAYIIASNLVKQFNVNAYSKKLDVKFKLEYREETFKSEHKIKKNLKKFNALTKPLTYTPLAQLVSGVINKEDSNLLIDEASQLTKTTEFKFKTQTLYVYTDTPIYKLFK